MKCDIALLCECIPIYSPVLVFLNPLQTWSFLTYSMIMRLDGTALQEVFTEFTNVC